MQLNGQAEDVGIQEELELIEIPIEGRFSKIYALTINGVNKIYLATEEDAKNVINIIKSKYGDETLSNIVLITEMAEDLSNAVSVDNAIEELYKLKAISLATGVEGEKSTGEIAGINLVKPVIGAISSRYGLREEGIHDGLDICAPTGTTIRAAGAGLVTCAEYKAGYGYLIVIGHENNIETYYAHCSSIYVSKGDIVYQGQEIGEVGSTGNSTGPHLHFEIRENGVTLDPQYYLY